MAEVVESIMAIYSTFQWRRSREIKCEEECPISFKNTNSSAFICFNRFKVHESCQTTALGKINCSKPANCHLNEISANVKHDHRNKQWLIKQ